MRRARFTPRRVRDTRRSVKRLRYPRGMSWGRGYAVALAIAAIAAVPPTARADAVVVEPVTCPPGAMAFTGHEGTYCAPTTCADDATCTRIASGRPGPRAQEGYACQAAVGVCVRTQSFDDHRGRRPDGTPVQIEREVAVAACGAGGSCPEGSQCQTARRCVERAASTPRRGALGCAAAPGHGSGAVLALIIAARLRRRRPA